MGRNTETNKYNIALYATTQYTFLWANFTIGIIFIRGVKHMATVGSVDVNLDNVGDIVNSSTLTGALIIGGLADQGDLIGTALGLIVAFGFISGAILAVFGVIFVILRFTKRIQGSKPQ